MKEPNEYKNNVHFWLRKIIYFLHFADVAEVRVLTQDEENKLLEGRDQDPEKGEPELTMRSKLKDKGHLDAYEPEKITKEEAEEACRKLYEMFKGILDIEVLSFVDDPRCDGGWPRGM